MGEWGCSGWGWWKRRGLRPPGRRRQIYGGCRAAGAAIVVLAGVVLAVAVRRRG
ncbi:MAG: hypothetical protein GX216_02110 [Methanomicrobiales archaeon]|nr:hypothetical protein [Methanomicrobiales archaeon]